MKNLPASFITKITHPIHSWLKFRRAKKIKLAQSILNQIIKSIDKKNIALITEPFHSQYPNELTNTFNFTPANNRNINSNTSTNINYYYTDTDNYQSTLITNTNSNNYYNYATEETIIVDCNNNVVSRIYTTGTSTLNDPLINPAKKESYNDKEEEALNEYLIRNYELKEEKIMEEKRRKMKNPIAQLQLED